MKYKAIIEYDGTYFCGFQKQNNNSESIQETLEKAVYKLSNESVTIYASGRTDAGVHAKGQVIHFSLQKLWPLNKLKDGINFYLKETQVTILNIENVDENFHARFNTKMRQYEYIICNRQAKLVLNKNRMWHIKYPLDHKIMQEGAKVLEGTHDFNAFRSVHCQSQTSIRTINEFTIKKELDYIIANISAKSFLYNQVRIMMGTLTLLGMHKITIKGFIEILNSKKRTHNGQTAPAHGLYFIKAIY